MGGERLMRLKGSPVFLIVIPARRAATELRSRIPQPGQALRILEKALLKTS
ncbi:MAG: hypothetical protein BWY82_01351 [Verrucomicrobia bacterium ADurb.Bin474]|nr:MAG: hypothetical protein BWY82_01351 [Verrucomicrobia bacterium ADurb.Bin474]